MRGETRVRKGYLSRGNVIEIILVSLKHLNGGNHVPQLQRRIRVREATLFIGIYVYIL